jgi:hypothetical protein
MKAAVLDQVGDELDDGLLASRDGADVIRQVVTF